jgi:hypothetical protein
LIVNYRGTIGFDTLPYGFQPIFPSFSLVLTTKNSRFPVRRGQGTSPGKPGSKGDPQSLGEALGILRPKRREKQGYDGGMMEYIYIYICIYICIYIYMYIYLYIYIFNIYMYTYISMAQLTVIAICKFLHNIVYVFFMLL